MDDSRATGFVDMLGRLGQSAASVISAVKGNGDGRTNAQQQEAMLSRPPSNTGTLLLIAGVVIAGVIALVMIFKK